MTTFHVLWNDKNKECSIRKMLPREDVVIYKKPFSDFSPGNKIILGIGAPLLGSADLGRDLVIIDMGWRDAIRFSKRFPDPVEKRSIADFLTAYPKTKPSSIRPEQGLRSVECMFAAKLLVSGNADEKLLDGYYFKDKFLEANKEEIKKYKK